MYYKYSNPTSKWCLTMTEPLKTSTKTLPRKPIRITYFLWPGSCLLLNLYKTDYQKTPFNSVISPSLPLSNGELGGLPACFAQNADKAPWLLCNAHLGLAFTGVHAQEHKSTKKKKKKKKAAQKHPVLMLGHAAVLGTHELPAIPKVERACRCEPKHAAESWFITLSLRGATYVRRRDALRR